MTFAVVQRELTAPTADQLVTAFLGSSAVVDHDARRTARRGFGILAENLDRADAVAVAGKLESLGVPALAVPTHELPALPAPRGFKRADPGEASLDIHDALGRPLPVAWDRVVLVAVGEITHIRPQRDARVERMATSTDAATINHDYREIEGHDLTLEIVLEHPAQRWRAAADALLYNYLGPRRRARRLDNFPLLVADLLAHSPRAAINRGAANLSPDEPNTLRNVTRYASRLDFEKELIWLLWWSGRGAETA